mmetsp:Transcript_32851/g.61104  ORF Transcript_32851/g.61104 Transcript_32851/m.61104 type:complete len:221 (-) Transcript_32851:622-1284(-)
MAVVVIIVEERVDAYKHGFKDGRVDHAQREKISLQGRRGLLASQGVEPLCHPPLLVQARDLESVAVFRRMVRVRLEIDEALHHRQVSKPRGDRQRRVFPLVREIRVRVGFQQSIDHAHVPLLRREVQRHAPVLSRGVHVRLPFSDEPADRGQMPALRGHEHGRGAVRVVGEVHLRAALADEQLDHVQVPVGRSDVRRRQSIAVGCVHLSLAFGDEPANHG